MFRYQLNVNQWNFRAFAVYYQKPGNEKLLAANLQRSEQEDSLYFANFLLSIEVLDLGFIIVK